MCVVMHIGGVTLTVEWLLYSLFPGLLHCFRKIVVDIFTIDDVKSHYLVYLHLANCLRINSFLRSSHMWESGSDLMLVYENREGLDGFLGETVSQLMTS